MHHVRNISAENMIPPAVAFMYHRLRRAQVCKPVAITANAKVFTNRYTHTVHCLLSTLSNNNLVLNAWLNDAVSTETTWGNARLNEFRLTFRSQLPLHVISEANYVEIRLLKSAIKSCLEAVHGYLSLLRSLVDVRAAHRCSAGPKYRSLQVIGDVNYVEKVWRFQCMNLWNELRWIRQCRFGEEIIKRTNAT